MSEPDIFDLYAQTKKAPDSTADGAVPSDATSTKKKAKSKPVQPTQGEVSSESEPVATNGTDKYSVAMIQIAAYNDANEPDADCPMPERILWWTLRDMYRKFRAGQMDKEQGEKAKQKAMRQYQQDKGDLDMYKRLVKHSAEMWRDIETKAEAYAKSSNRSDEADALFEAVYGVRPK